MPKIITLRRIALAVPILVLSQILICALLQANSLRATPVFLKVPFIRQSTNYSCGAAALLSVIEYYGFDDYNESELISLLGTDAASGTEMERMSEFAAKIGLDVKLKVNAEISDISASVQTGNPVIISMQAWPEKEKTPEEYLNTWDDGHYSVVIGIDKKNIYFTDPSLAGSRGFIPIKEFLMRWHDIGTKGAKENHPAIFFKGVPQPPPSLAPIP